MRNIWKVINGLQIWGGIGYGFKVPGSRFKVPGSRFQVPGFLINLRTIFKL